jgi:hypothetical protein
VVRKEAPQEIRRILNLVKANNYASPIRFAEWKQDPQDAAIAGYHQAETVKHVT